MMTKSVGQKKTMHIQMKGNFVELVRFRAETDPILVQHLAKSPCNAQYTSKTIQNDLVEVIGGCI